jgi:hypothetical protein
VVLKKGFVEMVAPFPPCSDTGDEHLNVDVVATTGDGNGDIPFHQLKKRSNSSQAIAQEYRPISSAELQHALTDLQDACTERENLNLKNYGLRLTDFSAATAAGRQSITSICFFKLISVLNISFIFLLMFLHIDLHFFFSSGSISPDDAIAFVAEANTFQECMPIRSPLLFLYLSMSLEMSRPLDPDNPFKDTSVDLPSLISRKVR